MPHKTLPHTDRHAANDGHRSAIRTTALMWLLAMASWLAGCANPGETASLPFTRPAAWAAFEQRHLTQAKLENAEGDLAEAAYHWEVLTVLRPDEPVYKEQLDETRAHIERKAAELTRLARQAQQKGGLEEATQRYLSVLALQPDDKAAAQALRAIERERIKRDQLGRYSSRQLMQPRIPVRKAPATSTP